MSENPNQPNEIEISLGDNAELKLTKINIDSEELPIQFSIDGMIQDVDSDIMNELQGQDLKPIAIRFQPLRNSE